MLTRPPSTRSVWPINSVKASNSINASVDCCCPTAARYINMLTRPPSTRSVWPINSINTSESRQFGSEVRRHFVRPTFDGRHNTAVHKQKLDLRQLGLFPLIVLFIRGQCPGGIVRIPSAGTYQGRKTQKY